MWPDPLRPVGDSSAVSVAVVPVGVRSQAAWVCTRLLRGARDGDTFPSVRRFPRGQRGGGGFGPVASGLSGTSAGNSEEVNKHVLTTGINSHLPPKIPVIRNGGRAAAFGWPTGQQDSRTKTSTLGFQEIKKKGKKPFATVC